MPEADVEVVWAAVRELPGARSRACLTKRWSFAFPQTNLRALIVSRFDPQSTLINNRPRFSKDDRAPACESLYHGFPFDVSRSRKDRAPVHGKPLTFFRCNDIPCLCRAVIRSTLARAGVGSCDSIALASPLCLPDTPPTSCQDVQRSRIWLHSHASDPANRFRAPDHRKALPSAGEGRITFAARKGDLYISDLQQRRSCWNS